MQLEVNACLDEVFIRSGSNSTGREGVYEQAYVDLPVNVCVEGGTFYMTYRRDLNRVWSLSMSEKEKHNLIGFINKSKMSGQDDEVSLSGLLRKVESVCQSTISSLNVDITRRDGVERLIRDERVIPLAKTIIREGLSFELAHIPKQEFVLISYADLGAGHLIDSIQALPAAEVVEVTEQVRTLYQTNHNDLWAYLAEKMGYEVKETNE